MSAHQATRRNTMSGNLWVTLCCTLILTASLPAANAAQPPGSGLPPPPGTTASPSDLGASKSPLQSPLQASVQAPDKAVQAPVQAPAQCGPQYVTCTIMVPQTTYKTITVPAVICRPETRQQNVTVCRMVPETQMVTCKSTICVPEQRTATQNYTVCRMVPETVSRQITVMVPQTETRQGTRTVCRPVAVQETRTVCKDMGHCETRCYVDCCGCTRTCEVWVPNIVTEQVPITVYKPQNYQENFNYQVTVCHPEQRTITQQVAKPVYETRSRQVNYTVPVAKQIERQVPQTTLRQVTENKVVNYTVMVPQKIERQVTVPVCTMVPKQVTYAVPPPCSSCGGVC
jgi:YTV